MTGDGSSPILARRRAQAEVIGPIFEEMVQEIGRERAEAILGSAIRKAAIAEGARYRAAAAEAAEDDPVAAFAELFELWTRGGALEIELLGQSPERFDFDVTRCRYAEMYREMGLGGIGHLLSCGRDGAFVEGYDPEMKLERDQTIMSGAPCCTFRYRRAPAGG
ncbi:L-2-amino-thiazoline-4-carboxylic acid hydrolase [Amaricoccus sp. B4]|uniref:L-2-amino-thiazoline-4-carboxylic acid hydrolase n=1 Tax=Amaricoccus sp. B4 TaxID=3368557 RepID=UPI0037224045